MQRLPSQSTRKDMVCGQDCLARVAQNQPVPGINAPPMQYGLPFVRARTLIGSDSFPALQPVFGRKPLMTASSLRVERPPLPMFVDGL